jgi:DNA-binding ferritin-like protein (Dps family)
MKLCEIIEQKKKWRAHVRRVQSLPRDYRIVYREIQRYLFKLGPVEFEHSTDLLSGIVDLLEEGAASKKDVLDVTGKDVAAFCDGLISGITTYADLSEAAVDRKVRKTMKTPETASQTRRRDQEGS